MRAASFPSGPYSVANSSFIAAAPCSPPGSPPVFPSAFVNLDSAFQSPGNIAAPGVVATRISRRTREPCCNAKCCARTPPQEKPIRSTRSIRIRASNRLTLQLIVAGLYGTTGSGDPPVPGMSIAMNARSGMAAASAATASMFAPIPFRNRTGQCADGSPRRQVATRIVRPPACSSVTRASFIGSIWGIAVSLLLTAAAWMRPLQTGGGFDSPTRRLPRVRTGHDCRSA